MNQIAPINLSEDIETHIDKRKNEDWLRNFEQSHFEDGSDEKTSDDFRACFTFDKLYESLLKCRREKIYKASVAYTSCFGLDEMLKLEEEIKKGTYKPRKPHTFEIMYPKRRTCSSIHIRDRIVQRSLNDNYVYPLMVKDFIEDNWACQTGKGTVAALNRLSYFLHQYWLRNNQSFEGYVLKCDIKGYYKHIDHELAKECFLEKLDPECVKLMTAWLNVQYPEKCGYDPGSQMVQILGISFLNDFDHFVKHTLKAKYYERYMDDFFIISDSKEELEGWLEQIRVELAKIKLNLNQDKTKVTPLAEGVPMLGFTVKLTETGKVVRIINSNNVKHERKKLRRMQELVKKNLMTPAKLEECQRSWLSHAELGNTYQVIQRMRDAGLLSRVKNQNNDNKEVEKPPNEMAD